MPRINTTVELNNQEQEICRALAKQRYANNRKEGMRNAKRGRQSNEDTDLEGVGSEVAFCKIINLYADFGIRTRPADDDDGDFNLKDGRAVDVKATRYKSGRLVALPWKNGNARLFALMIGTFPKYAFKGFMTADELLRPECLGSLGHGPSYIPGQDELVPFVLPVLQEGDSHDN